MRNTCSLIFIQSKGHEVPQRSRLPFGFHFVALHATYNFILHGYSCSLQKTNFYKVGKFENFMYCMQKKIFSDSEGFFQRIKGEPSHINAHEKKASLDHWKKLRKKFRFLNLVTPNHRFSENQKFFWGNF